MSSASFNPSRVSTRLQRAVRPFCLRLRSTIRKSALRSSITRIFIGSTIFPSPKRRFVDRQPVNSETRHRFSKFTKVERLAHETVGAVMIACQPVPLLVLRGQNHNWLQAGPRVVAQSLQDIQATDTRQANVEQDDSREVVSCATGKLPFPEQVVKGLLPVAHHVHLIGQIDLTQCSQDQFFVLGIVFHHQNGLVDIHRISLDCSSPYGSENRNVAPSWGVPVAEIVPPWRCTMRWTVARPMPMPGNSSCRCRRWNG